MSPQKSYSMGCFLVRPQWGGRTHRVNLEDLDSKRCRRKPRKLKLGIFKKVLDKSPKV